MNDVMPAWGYYRHTGIRIVVVLLALVAARCWAPSPAPAQAQLIREQTESAASRFIGTNTTMLPATRVDIGIRFVEEMSSFALRQSRVADLPVFAGRQHNQVRWLDAPHVATDVMDFMSWRNSPLGSLEGESMGAASAAGPIDEDAIAGPDSDAAPFPAIAAWPDLEPESPFGINGSTPFDSLCESVTPLSESASARPTFNCPQSPPVNNAYVATIERKVTGFHGASAIHGPKDSPSGGQQWRTVLWLASVLTLYVDFCQLSYEMHYVGPGGIGVGQRTWVHWTPTSLAVVNAAELAINTFAPRRWRPWINVATIAFHVPYILAAAHRPIGTLYATNGRTEVVRIGFRVWPR